jgi:WD40 repeat protein
MTEKYRLRSTLKHDAEVCGIAICGNTGKIVTSSDRMIRLWTVHGEDLSKTSFDTPASTVRCISWIPPNPTLKSGGVSGCVNNAVVVWDVDSGKIVKTLDHESEVTGIVVDGDDLVSSSIDG